MTNHWVDIKNANLIVIMGGNPAEAHPVGFRWVVDAKIHNNAKILVIDPRFTRSAAVADEYMALRAGTDIVFLLGVVNYLLANDRIQHEYVRNYTNADFLVREDFSFQDGLFSGYDAEKGVYDKTSWAYQLDSEGFAKRDPSLSDPRCVLNLLREHVSRYTPDVVENICGTPQDRFKVACEMIAETAAPNKTMSSLYALGWTEHTTGSQNIRAMAIIQLLLGNIGMPGGGVNALRGHTNVQGITDLGIMATALPGYLALPSEKRHPDLSTFLATVTPKLQVRGQINFWGNYPKFFISLLKSFYGDKATPENNFGFDWLPKWDTLNDFLYTTSVMEEGKLNGCICQGVNMIASFPDTNRSVQALSKLKYLVVIDPLDNETSSFWENHGEFNDVNSASIQTEVFRLPSSCFAEEDGSRVNSARWLQWHWKGADIPGEGRGDSQCIAGIMMAVRRLYESEGGTAPDPLLNMSWNYANPEAPTAEAVAREMNGRALADLTDASGNIVVRKGQQLSAFGQLRDDGTTSCGCWIFSGCWTEAGNQMARRDNADPSGLGNTPGWAWAWPLNRRVLYNRASMDPQGNPWDPKRKLLWWNGTAWTGYDVPDFAVTAAPGSAVTPFIMQPDGVGGLFAQGKLAEGPFPEHYEPMETPLGTNPLHPNVVFNPMARIINNHDNFGDSARFPYVATTYRLTEHFHTLTKASKLNAVTQPEAFAEISETLAKKIGVKSGDMIKVSSSRGFVKVKAAVTKRIQKLTVNGREVETVGLPIHWGFKGAAVKGYLTNRLTPSVGDANTQTPEYKAFLVNVEKA